MADALAHLTAGLKELLHKQTRLDQLELEASHGQERERIARWRETNIQAIDHLERAVAAVPAAGPQEAVIQVLVAAGRIQNLSAETEDAKLVEDLAVARLLLRSGLLVLAQAGGLDLVGSGAAYYGQTEADSPFFREEPHDPADETGSSTTG
jgi:hypothetical protein